MIHPCHWFSMTQLYFCISEEAHLTHYCLELHTYTHVLIHVHAHTAGPRLLTSKNWGTCCLEMVVDVIASCRVSLLPAHYTALPIPAMWVCSSSRLWCMMQLPSKELVLTYWDIGSVYSPMKAVAVLWMTKLLFIALLYLTTTPFIDC